MSEELEVVIDKSPLPCDVCGVNMNKDGIKCIGSHFSLRWHNDLTHPEYERLIDVFGKWEFNICWVCTLTTYGVKPKGRDED